MDLWRFFREASLAESDAGLEALTLGQFVRARRFGSEFSRHFLVPLAASVWSMPPGRIDGFPALFFLQFLRNHGLLGRAGRWRWRTVSGGSRAYVQAITGRLGLRARCSTPVRSVKRSSNGTQLILADGSCHAFDATVFACHANEASELLDNKSGAEADALDCFQYSRNRVVLHTDQSLLPRRPSARASWNYTTQDCHDEYGSLAVTYNLNRLQALNEPLSYNVSVNPPPSIRPEHIIQELQYDHPSYSFQTLEGQRRIARINGQNGIFYAGAHLGFGFHEDGVASAARVAAMLGVSDA